MSEDKWEVRNIFEPVFNEPSRPNPSARNRGVLVVNENGRWEVRFEDREEIELTSGSVVEVRVGDQWVRTRIEHGSQGYYAVASGVRLFEGQEARIPR